MKRFFYNPLYNQNAELGLFACGHEKCPIDFSNGPGMRKKYILHYIISGKGWYEVNSKKYFIQKGDAFAIYPDDLVTYYTDKNDPWEFCWFIFDGSIARKCYDAAGISHERLVIHGVDVAFFDCVINCLEYCESNKGICSQLKLASYIIECLTYLEQLNTAMPPYSITKKYADTAIAYIEQYYSQGIGVEDIANQLGLERTYFYRIFIKETGVSPSRYLINFRIKKAKKLILNGMGFKAVANAVGIKDVYYFSKLFKKSEGITPTEYKFNNIK